MTLLSAGDPAPWFKAPTSSNPQFNFASVAGRYLVLAFVSSSRSFAAKILANVIAEHRPLFDDDKVALFGVTNDPLDFEHKIVRDTPPGVRWFYDPDRKLAELYSLVKGDGPLDERWFLIDPALRIISHAPVAQAVSVMSSTLRKLGFPSRHAGVELFAPVLLTPRIFEPELCVDLIDYYRKAGGVESGFMTERDGKTVAELDYTRKRRADCTIQDEKLREACRIRIHRRLIPEIEKVFQYRATRMERYIVSCYEAKNGGKFTAHRDNGTKGTAHRRFAVTLNLNADDYDGGELVFPEFGKRRYKPPTGGAVVFSCSLLHQATLVTRGERFVFLPFLYDEAGAALRKANSSHIADPALRYIGYSRATDNDLSR